MSKGLAVFQGPLSCRREGLAVWDIFIFWMVSEAECFSLASGDQLGEGTTPCPLPRPQGHTSSHFQDSGLLGIDAWGAGSWQWPGLCFSKALFIEGIEADSGML